MDIVKYNEESFLKLLISYMVTKNQFFIPEKKELQKELVKFYDDPVCEVLFRNIAKVDGINYKYVDLRNAFESAYFNGILRVFRDSNEDKNMINITPKQAVEIYMQYNYEQLVAMDKICKELIKPKEDEKIINLKNNYGFNYYKC